MSKIKICGLTRPQDMMAANECMPDYIGFVFAPSKRQVTEQQAADLKRLLNHKILAVGVFVNAPKEQIIRLVQNKVIDLVQLHGEETQEDILALKAQLNCPVIKAVRVQTQEQITAAQQLPCDYLLLDSWQPKQHGGSGVAFDYRLIPSMKKPYFLAGGLIPENLPQAVDALAPFGVDISSGVETQGVKDPEKMRRAVQAVRQRANESSIY